MGPTLPQNDRDPDARRSELNARRDAWQYAYDWPPGLATVADLPKGEGYTAGYMLGSLHVYLDIAENIVALGIEDFAPGDVATFVKGEFEHGRSDEFAQRVFRAPQRLAATAPHKHPASIRDYDKLYKTWSAPPVVAAMNDGFSAFDQVFAWQRVGGVNPMVLARTTKLPDNFRITPALYTEAMPGDTLAAALAEGRAYLCDYAALDGIQTGVTDGITKYIAAPIALFAVDPNTKMLLPVAIQTGQTPDAALVTPRDGWNWRAAQTLVQIADANLHEGIAHLGRTHLVMEAVSLSMQRNLASKHPLFRLLHAHLEITNAINHSAKTSLIAPGGTVDRTFAPSIDAFAKVVQANVANYPLATTAPVRDLHDRGLDDVSALPSHPYRDEVLPIWRALRAYLGEYVQLYYADDAAVLGDSELQAFVRELSSQDGGRLKDVPTANTIDELVFLLTRIVFIAGPQHSAVNFPQFPNMGFPPNMPGASYAPAFAAGATLTEADVVAMLPTWKITIESTTMVYLLSNVRDSKLGHYGPEWLLGDPRLLPIVERFKSALSDIESQSITRDASRLVSYPFLRPSQILQSISI